MKFGRNLIKNDWAKVTTTANIDRWRLFCRWSCLSDVGQNPYLNLIERLIKSIHIWSLEEIWLKMTELDWPRQRILIDGGHFVGHLVIWCLTKPVFRLKLEVDGSNPFTKFERNPIKHDWVRVTTTVDIDKWRPFCWPSWLSDEVDGSNPYMKFGRNLIKNDWARVTKTADIDRWRPFCRPSWSSDVGQSPYSNLIERLMEAIHIWSLEEIW